MGTNFWVVIGLALLFFVPYVRRVVYFPYLYFHEFGHSIMAMLLRVKRKRMSFNVQEGSGNVMVSWNPRHKVRILLVGSIGYIFPVLVVMAGILAIQYEKVEWFMLGLLLSLIYGVWNTRTFAGWVIIAVALAIGWRMYQSGELTEDIAIVIAESLVWLLVMGCLRTIITLVNNYRKVEKENNGDASLLSREIGFPVVVWVGFFILVNVYTVFLVYWRITNTKIISFWN